MNKQKLNYFFILSLLLALSIIYSANVFVSYYQKSTIIVMTDDLSKDSNDNSEENVKETSHHLFLQERPLYYLKSLVAIKANFAAYISKVLPETCLQLNTPPPDLA